MSDSKANPAELLSLIADKALELRKAGITRFALDGLSVELAPYVEPEPQLVPTQASPARESLDPLDDPETFGLPPGSPVPGFAALRDRKKGSRA